MAVEVLKDIQVPAQNNLTWIFKVRVNGGGLVDWKVDSFDLGLWFKEVVGRYPRHERGDSDERADILDNWSRIVPKLVAEAEREASLQVRIGVDGTRFGARESREAYSIPKEELPPLTDGQREVARKLGVSEEGYARSFVAGGKTTNGLLEKTGRFANLLQRLIKKLHPEARVDSVTLETIDRRFRVELDASGERIPVTIDESVVDDYFQNASDEAERRLGKVLERAFAGAVQ